MSVREDRGAWEPQREASAASAAAFVALTARAFA